MLAAMAGVVLALQVGASAPDLPSIEPVQFPARPGGACPRGYDFNFSNGRCYPNEYKAPGVYNRPIPDYGYDRSHRRGYPRYSPPDYYGR
jgi:hypothetical protein